MAGRGIQISNVGNLEETEERVKINITGDGKDIELCIERARELKFTRGKDIELKIDEHGDLKLKCEQPLQIVIPKPKLEPKPIGGSSDEKPKTEGGISDGDTRKDGGSSNEKTKSEKPGGSSDQKTKSEEQKRTEKMLRNAMIKLNTYKGIVITAVIAISLGFLLRRKFKAAGH